MRYRKIVFVAKGMAVYRLGIAEGRRLRARSTCCCSLQARRYAPPAQKGVEREVPLKHIVEEA